MDSGKLSFKLSVSELTSLIKQHLEENFPVLTVEGEISNYRPSSTGHLYFTLKDEKAAISCMMFQSQRRNLRFKMEDGMLLRVRGRLSVYALRGTYSIICDEIELAGQGEILAMLEDRKRRLAAEGLFDEERKKPLPRFPQTVGVVSSPTGAAVRDILNILGRRAAGVRVIILPAPVQGPDAGALIAHRIEQASQWKLCDVLIVGRGGGSLEDLLPFSEEAVVRAIGRCAIPVVSAVGHEIDWALSDYAADMRAPTPSAAAELVSENREAALERIRELGENIREAMEAKLERARLLIRPFGVEELEERFMRILEPALMRLDDAKESLIRGIEEKTEDLRRRMELASTALNAASPLSILERGFSVVLNGKTGKLVRSSSDAEAGDELHIRPLEGSITAIVKKTGGVL
jgi:exodeoxyribonuclease VII large subunit